MVTAILDTNVFIRWYSSSNPDPLPRRIWAHPGL
jgi:hypothetical protein